VGIELKFKILRIEILDMTVGELYVIVEWSNIANFFKKHPEYPLHYHKHTQLHCNGFATY